MACAPAGLESARLVDSPAPLSESEAALPMLELIEQLATRAGVPVDSRIERGRTPRHALTALLDNEGYDTLVVPAKTSASDGFDPTDIAWLLENAPGEVLVLRPEPVTGAPGSVAPSPPAGSSRTAGSGR